MRISIPNTGNLMQQFLMTIKSFTLQATGKGHLEDLDIYVSNRDSTGDWGPQKTLVLL